MKSLGEVLKLSTDFLNSKGISRSRRIAEELIAEVLNLKRLDLYMQFDRPIDAPELERMRGFLRHAAAFEPLEYILKKSQFYGCSLYLDSRVLIPRPETEILLDKVCKLLEQESCEGKIALDLCCGSGCLGIALKKKLPSLQVILSDVSELALEVASENARLNDVSVEILQGDLLSSLQGRKVDFILCNPPYLSEVEYVKIDPSVRDYEPKLALVGGVEGSEFYRRLEMELPTSLNSGARLFFEIGFLQGTAVKEIFTGASWRSRRVEQDWAGHDRFFFLEFE